MKDYKGKIALSIISVTVVIGIALALALFATQNDAFAERVVSLGYAGIIIAAYISGLNLIVPVPASAFVPVFTAAGFAFPVVIALMVFGTVLADLTGYAIGYYGRHVQRVQESKWYHRMKKLAHEHKHWVLPFLFFYAAAVPIPNELIVIPLSLLGYRLITLIVPLTLGTIVHITVYALGAEGLFSLLSNTLGL